MDSNHQSMEFWRRCDLLLSIWGLCNTISIWYFIQKNTNLKNSRAFLGFFFCCLEAAIARWTQKSMPDFIKNNIGISLYNSNITICIFRLLILNQQLELKSDIQNAKNTGCIETPISRNNWVVLSATSKNRHRYAERFSSVLGLKKRAGCGIIHW